MVCLLSLRGEKGTAFFFFLLNSKDCYVGLLYYTRSLWSADGNNAGNLHFKHQHKQDRKFPVETVK